VLSNSKPFKESLQKILTKLPEQFSTDFYRLGFCNSRANRPVTAQIKLCYPEPASDLLYRSTVGSQQPTSPNCRAPLWCNKKPDAPFRCLKSRFYWCLLPNRSSIMLLRGFSAILS